ncbi:MAG: alpha-glucosidase, partial [Boseongicola sp. SB0670_bin_30]|nr:alpha-glucosidase [Boseongicola sp. SB0670_bin_30]
VFGGSAWQWDGARMQYYMHNFLREQPDLNFHNMDVQDALLDVARFWLQRGVDGFRLDTVNFYAHDPELKDNPPLSNVEVTGMTAPSVNPYSFQSHVNDKSRPENIEFLKRLRAVMDEFQDITTVGEVGDDQRGLEIQAEYTQGRDRLHMCYGFEFLSSCYPTGARIAEVLERFQRIARDSWACWAFSNHDVVRHTTRWSLSPEAHRAYLAVLLSLRGSVCLYQGEELGLHEADVDFEDLHDPYGIRFWPAFKGRDGCRTPMVWLANGRHGGFSDAKPWLPVAEEHVSRAVDAQERDPDSMLNFYRRMIAYRASRPALVKGTFDVVEADEGFLSAIRTCGRKRLFTAFNLSGLPREVVLPAGAWTTDHDAPFDANHDTILQPWQATFKEAN